MALSDFRTATMGSITQHFTTTARPVFEAAPMLGGLLLRLDALHAEFVTHQQHAQAKAGAVAELRGQAAALDARHDAGLDRCYTLLSALAPFYAADRAAALIALRNRLMPGGLSMKQRSYQDQGAAAESAKAAFTAADRALLQAVAPPDVDLVAAMNDWIEAGLTLRTVDAKRATQSEAPSPSTSPGALRRRWMKLVLAIRANAALVDLDDAQRALLFAKLDEEDARAIARRGSPAEDAPVDNPG